MNERPEIGLMFHHVGVACLDLDDEAAKLAVLAYRQEGPDFADPVQGVKGRFLIGPDPRLELLTPLPGGGVLDPWLRGGTKLYHLAYMVEDMPRAIETLRTQRAKLVVKPVPAVAFDGRQIAFLMLANRLLVELISKA